MNDTLTIYILDSSAKKPIKAGGVVIDYQQNGMVARVRLFAVPEKSDPPGQSSRFQLKGKELAHDLDAKGARPYLSVEINGKTYTGKLEHERLFRFEEAKLAHWVLDVGGKLTILDAGERRAVTQASDFPADPFRVVEIDLLDYPAATDEDLARLKDLTLLEVLHLKGKGITDAGLEHLAGLTALNVLKLYTTSVTGTGFKHFTRLNQLRSLSAGYGTLFTNEGLAQLAQLKSLTGVSFTAAAVTDEGLGHLAQLRGLEYLRIGWGKLNEQGLRFLNEGRGKLRDLFALCIAAEDVDASGPAVVPCEIAGAPLRGHQRKEGFVSVGGEFADGSRTGEPALGSQIRVQGQSGLREAVIEVTMPSVFQCGEKIYDAFVCFFIVWIFIGFESRTTNDWNVLSGVFVFG